MEMDGAIEYYYEDNEQLEDDEQAIINFDTEMQHNEHEEQTSAVENNLHGTIETFSNMTEDEIKGSLLGYSAETAEELYDLYTKHSTLVGFSVRKGTVRRVSKTGIVKEKYYLCSFEGKRRETKPKTPKPNVENSKKKKPKQQAITRVGCKAMIRVKKNKEGLFEVVQHVMHHNHSLTRLPWQHFHRSERQINAEKGKTIEALQKAGIRPSDSYRYLCAEAGGEEYVGHTLRDHMNFTNRLKMKEIEGQDSQSVINMLIQQAEDDLDFFFRVRLNEKAQVSTIFWRDSMMKEDFEIYGDVCVFDTTYQTNRYNLICAPFVGVNNHWRNVMFACAFIGDETTETFVWVFETFLKSMGGKAPITLFTDQDHAMASAILQVFPHTRHRLCLWHLQKNAVERFGALKSNDKFKEEFKKCLYGCYSEKEFKDTWDAMISKYELGNDEWFKNLYNLREKWCTALSKDFFSAGILSTQRSESTNNAISFKGNKTTSLNEFFQIFLETIRRWRSQESNDEFSTDIALPQSTLPMVGMLKHAAKVYTLTLFRDFEKEFKYAMGCISRIEQIQGDFIGYRVKHEEWPEHTGHKVAYDPGSQFVLCTCKNFEESGWLCFHAIRVLHVHSVTTIPEHYISKRWTRYAKSEVWKKRESLENSAIEKTKVTPWRYEMARSFYNIILKCQYNDEAKKALKSAFHKVVAEIDAILSSKSTITTTEENESNSTNQQQDIMQVLDPERAKTKGRTARKKGHFETKDTASSSKRKEFGTATPNPKLF